MKRAYISYSAILLFSYALSGRTINNFKPITLEDIYTLHKFTPHSIAEPYSMKDGKHFAYMSGNEVISLYSYEPLKKMEALFDAGEFDQIDRIESFTFDPSEQRILLTTNNERIYRHSFLAEFFIYDLKEKKLLPVSKNGKQRLAKFSPDGKMVAFVRDNNLFIADPFRNFEKQVTFDGSVNNIINGSTDWVYEEEFASDDGFAWSPDSKLIAFYRFDESRVKEFDMTIYKGLYPEIYSFKYPKAGEKNSVVTVHVYDLKSGKIKQVDTGTEKDQYIPRIKWTHDPGILSMIRLNRMQNHLDILHADVKRGTSVVVYEETNKYFISEPNDHTVTYLPDEKHFIILSERDGYFHYYLYNFIDKEISPITTGNYDVAEFNGYDALSGRLYYTSYEDSPLERHVYGININGSDKVRISSGKGFNRALFSKDFGYYLLYNVSATSPEKVELYKTSGELIRVIDENERVKNNMAEYGFVPVEFFKIPADEGLELNAYMIKPPDFDPEKVYPLFIYVYGGPESQKVAENWESRGPWFQMLAQNGYVVACIDNRGTNGRGEAYRKSTYMQLGKYETIDQVNAANYLADLPYIDESRIGIFGWSYGGFMTALCMTKGGGIYKIGISVAPVTNWRFYDTVYTERFMRTPAENPEGYDDNSPINFADQLHGKLLLVHGTGDDNVHFQNSAEFVAALVKAGKQFDMQFYTNENHSIRSAYATIHLYTRMTEFILTNL